MPNLEFLSYSSAYIRDLLGETCRVVCLLAKGASSRRGLRGVRRTEGRAAATPWLGRGCKPHKVILQNVYAKRFTDVERARLEGWGEHSLHDPIRDNIDKTAPEANLPHSSKTLRPLHAIIVFAMLFIPVTRPYFSPGI